MIISYLSNSPLENKFANCVHVMQMCRAFAKAGHKCTLHASGSSNNYEKHYFDYGVEQSFDINIFPQLKIKYLGLILYGLRQAFHAKYKVKPDICYARCTVSAYFALLIGMYVIFEIHDIPYSRFSSWLYKKIINSNKTLRIVCISEALKFELSKEISNAVLKKIVVAHDGANNSHNKALKNNKIKCSETYKLKVGYAGGLREGNGIAHIIKLAETNPEIEFNIAGGSINEVNFWKNRSNCKNIIWHGSKLPREIHDFLLENDILLAPYQIGPKTNGGKDTAKWMSPLKIFEYMAAGKVLIVSDFPVLREVLDNKTSILLEPKNVGNWSKTLKYLADNYDLRRMYGENAKDKLFKNYTWDARAKYVVSQLDIFHN
jgi:glycosyltransferase involved in cell wall biosynthesis